MNRDAILFQLREAREELDRTIKRIASEPAYDEEEFKVAMSHFYHHINSAWNGRRASRERHRDCIDDDFHAWRKFPPYSELYLDEVE